MFYVGRVLIYPVYVRKGTGGTVDISIPDLPDVSPEISLTVFECDIGGIAIQVRKALEEFVGVDEKGRTQGKFPKQSSIEELQKNPGYTGGTWHQVKIGLETGGRIVSAWSEPETF